MTINSDFSGLKKLKNNVEEIQEQGGFSLAEILNDRFIQNATPFNNLNELFEKGGFKFESVEEFEALPEDELNSFIASISNYSTFQEMIRAATMYFTRNKLFKGL